MYIYIYAYLDKSLIGFLKLQVIFCKRATNYRALLTKMTYFSPLLPMPALQGGEEPLVALSSWVILHKRAL